MVATASRRSIECVSCASRRSQSDCYVEFWWVCRSQFALCCDGTTLHSFSDRWLPCVLVAVLSGSFGLGRISGAFATSWQICREFATGHTSRFSGWQIGEVRCTRARYATKTKFFPSYLTFAVQSIGASFGRLVSTLAPRRSWGANCACLRGGLACWAVGCRPAFY